MFERNKGAITREMEVGRKEGRKRESGRRGEEEEEEEKEEKAASGISWPAAPSGTRHERHFYSDRKSDSREQ